MLIDSKIVRFCAIECKMQMSGEESVANMIDAWIYAQDMVAAGTLMYEKAKLPTVDDVLTLGRLIEPLKNVNGWRKVDVRVGWDVKMPWEDVPVFMTNLMTDLYNGAVTNEEFIFQSLGVCHCFRDGNGRTNQILWNWLEGTLDNPTWHKDFWSDSRRTPGFGAPKEGM